MNLLTNFLALDQLGDELSHIKLRRCCRWLMFWRSHDQ